MFVFSATNLLFIFTLDISELSDLDVYINVFNKSDAGNNLETQQIINIGFNMSSCIPGSMSKALKQNLNLHVGEYLHMKCKQ